MTLYTTIYNMCNRKQPLDFSSRLYDNYKMTFDDYINSSVLPSLKEKDDEFMLEELSQRWLRFKVMIKWMSHLFCYLERYFVIGRSLPRLDAVGRNCFIRLAYQNVQVEARKFVMDTIRKEREHGRGQIDISSWKSIVDMFVELDRYKQDFEVPVLTDTKNYYRNMASKWIKVDSCPHYMLKAEGCLKREINHVSHYLHPDTKPKLAEIVQHEVLVSYAYQLLRDQKSGCRTLLMDNKVEDLARLYSLYHEIPKGLNVIVNEFKQHMVAEVVALKSEIEKMANQAADVTIIEQGEKAASIQVLFNKFIELFNNGMANVEVCFMNNTLFNEILKDVFDFEVYLNEKVASISIVELLATFCGEFLKKAESEKLSDEALAETFEMVAKLLPYIRRKEVFEKLCREKLCHRLLVDRAANKDHESCFLTKLKQQYGREFTLKMEGMLRTLESVEGRQERFKKHFEGVRELFDEFYRERLYHRFVADRRAIKDHESSLKQQQYIVKFTSRVERMQRTVTLVEDSQEKYEKLIKNIEEVFEEFCMQKLSQVDGNVNKDLLTKLKQHHGYKFTQKMRDMLKKHIQGNNNEDPDIDFRVIDLPLSCWPNCYPSSNITLPPEIVCRMAEFQHFYELTYRTRVDKPISNRKKKKNKRLGIVDGLQFKGRILQWNHTVGTCTLMCNFDSEFELTVTICQAAALLLFNSADRLSYTDIKTRLKLSGSEDLERLLLSLSGSKYKILIKEPDNQIISPDDFFVVNSGFSCPTKKLTVPLPPVEKMMKKDTENRKYIIDAAIVRIMKRRKVLSHQDLVSQCINQLSDAYLFMLIVLMLKKSRSGLIFLLTLDIWKGTRIITLFGSIFQNHDKVYVF
ncbi:hypothetical protein RIF29_35112 [Crotalaria pallida]|uniref:Cullin family profile domain-containing protein n=1 Tax=Crotalaria pallida TaxID=3830 RepID=A0AAN9HXS2_CROPI